jgi:hypothetical protein
MFINDFFRNKVETTFFDEGPSREIIENPTLVNTSSISTSEIDAYRQGVEITNITHFDAGMFKIHSGEPMHRLHRSTFGQGSSFRDTTQFDDISKFELKKYPNVYDLSLPQLTGTLNIPTVTTSTNIPVNYVVDGVAEPFTIRSRSAYKNIDIVFDPLGLKGEFGNGNTDRTNSTDNVVTIYENSTTYGGISHVDEIDLVNNSIPADTLIYVERVLITPFSDQRLLCNTTSSTVYDSNMIAALSMMTGSTENYLNSSQRSATCGWTFDTTGKIGTDSIAFGGMTY